MSKEKKKTIILTVVLSVICLALIGFLVVDILRENGTIVDKETNDVMKDRVVTRYNKAYTSQS